MSKRLLLIILAVAAAAIFLWPRLFGFPRGSAPVVRLELGPTNLNAIIPGTAVTFDIYLEGGNGARLGSFAKPWYQFITLRRSDGAVLPWHLIQGADPYGMFSPNEGDKAMNFDKRRSSAAYFDGSPGYYRLQLLLSPEESKNISPGEYAVVASVEAPRFLITGRQTIAQSNPRYLTFTATSDQNLDLDRIAANAQFYLKTGKFSQALAVSKELLAREPKQARSHIAHGDALAGLGKKEDALAAYLEAQRLIPRSYESPQLLYQRIRRLGD